MTRAEHTARMIADEAVAIVVERWRAGRPMSEILDLVKDAALELIQDHIEPEPTLAQVAEEFEHCARPAGIPTDDYHGSINA